MKTRFILSLLCSIALSAVTFSLIAIMPKTAPAQEPLATREQRVDAQLALWRDSLHLTEAQAARIRELMLQQDDEATRDRAILESWIASHPDATEEEEAALQQRYASHMLAYDPLYDAYLDPWQRDIVIRIDLYHEHRRFLRGLWWRWWWWPWRIGPVWPPHHHGPYWPPRAHRPHHPPPAPPPPPIPPRPSRPHEPGPRTMPPGGSNQPHANPPPPSRQPGERTQPPPKQPSERTQPPQRQPRQEPQQQPRNEAPRQQPSSGQQPTQRPQRPGR